MCNNDNPDRAIAVAYTDEFSLDAIAAGEWTNYSGQDLYSLVCYNPNTELFENKRFQRWISAAQSSR
jgi:hypothetical protein